MLFDRNQMNNRDNFYSTIALFKEGCSADEDQIGSSMRIIVQQKFDNLSLKFSYFIDY